MYKKTMIAVAVAAMCSTAFAATEITDAAASTDEALLTQDVDYKLTNAVSGYKGFYSNKTGEAQTYSGTLSLTNEGPARMTGLHASGSTLTNAGDITITSKKSWQNKAMMAQHGGTAVNVATINATEAYGMTIGSSESGETNTIINDKGGVINVSSGVAMEAGGAGAKAIVTNNGTINVLAPTENSASQWTLGVLVKGVSGAEVTNNDTIKAAAGTAAIQVEAGGEDEPVTDKNTVTQSGVIEAEESGFAIRVAGGSGTVINLTKGSKTQGLIELAGTDTVLNADGVTDTLTFFDPADDTLIPASQDYSSELNIRSSKITVAGNGDFDVVNITNGSEVTFAETKPFEVTDEGYAAYKDAYKEETGVALPSYYDKQDVGYILNSHGADKLVIGNATVTNNGVITGDELVINDGGKFITGYSLAAGNSVVYKAVTVNEGGAFQVTNLNSAENTSLLIEDGVYSFLGGKLLQPDGEEYHGALKIGRSKSTGAALVLDKAAYQFESVALAANMGNPTPKAELTVGKDAKVTLGTLDYATGKVTVEGELTVTDKLLNAYLKESNQQQMNGEFSVAEGGAFTTNMSALGLELGDDGVFNSVIPVNEDGTGSATNTKFYQTGLIANSGTITVNLGDVTLGNSSLSALKNALQTAGSTGVVNIGDASLGNITDDGKITQDQLNDIENGVTNDALANADVVNVNAPVTGNKSVGSLTLADNDVTDTVQIGAVGDDTTQIQLNNSGLLAKDADGNAAKLEIAGSATLVVTGSEAALGEVAGTGNLTAAGDSLTVNGSLTLGSLNAKGDVKVEGAADIGTLVVSSGNFEMGAKTDGEVYKTVVGVLDVKSDSVLTAGNAEIGSGTVTGTALFKDLKVGGVLNVGSESKAGKLTIGKLKSGVIFMDPVFDETGTMAWGDASQVSVTGIDVGAGIEVGNASLLAVGATSAEAAAAMTNAGYVLSNSDSEDAVRAAAYVAAPVQGSIWVTGASSPTAGLADGAFIGEDGLVVIKSGAFTGADTSVFAGAVVNDGVIYLADFTVGDTVDLGTSYAGSGYLEIMGDRLQGVDADAATGIVSIVFDETGLSDLEGLIPVKSVAGFYTDVTGADVSRSGKWIRAVMASDASDADVVKTVNAAAGLGLTAGLQTVTLDASDAFAGSVAKRTGILTGLGQGVSIWADVNGGRYEAKKLFNGAGYSSDIYAGVLGADYTASCGGTIGMAVTVGTADTDTKNNIADASTDSDYWGLSVYAAKAFGNVKVGADFGYTASSNDVNAGLGIGKFSADTEAVTFGVRGEYLIEAGAFSIVPHVGLRWTHVATDDFEAAFKTDVDGLNVWRMPIGVTVAGNVEAAGWKLAPTVDLSVVPALGDKDADMTVGFGGTTAVDKLSVRVVDCAPVQATFGLAADNDNWSVGVSYQLGVGGHDRLNNAFNATVQYRF